jgi:tetratricopeptide (TPR) repeat protein
MSREACSWFGDDPPYRAEVMEQFLKHHADPNTRCDIGGDTALGTAACKGNLTLASVYVEHGANVDLADNGKMSPLSCAVMHEHANVVKLLLDHGANVEVKNPYGHTTPLQDAAHANDVSTVKLLIEKHANLEATDSDGKTPLLIASSRGNTQVVKLLLASHADESAKDSKGESAIDLATQAGRCDAVAELAHGAQEKTSACLRSFYTLAQIGFDDTAWRMDIEAGLALKPRPSVVPEEARQYFVQANDTFKNSQASVDAKKAIALYKKALVQAPWFAEAWNNLSLAEEKIGDYQEAAWALRNFTLVRPEAAHDRATLDHIYVLEGKTK